MPMEDGWLVCLFLDVAGIVVVVVEDETVSRPNMCHRWRVIIAPLIASSQRFVCPILLTKM